MGERLRRVAVEAFRGVPEKWDVGFPGGRSLVVWGDNGAGKSTIADALEWYFTGRIDFLGHEGRERAIRHVGASTARRTSVTIETDGDLGGQQVLERVSSPWVGRRVPDNLVLRGRTLADFVEKPKAEKYRALAVILGLEDIDRLRRDVQTVRNQLEEAATAKATERRQAASALRPDLGTVDEDRLLERIRERAVAAGMSPPASLDDALDPGWLPAAAGREPATGAVEAARLTADVRAALAAPPTVNGLGNWNAYLAAAEPAVPERLRFTRAADGLLAALPDDGRCPLCGQPADREGIRQRIVEALEELQAADADHTRAERAARRSVASIRSRHDLLRDLAQRASGLHLELAALPAVDPDVLLEAVASNRSVPEDDMANLLTLMVGWLSSLDRALESLPVAPSRDASLVELATLCEQGRRWRSLRVEAAAAARALALAFRLHVACQRVERNRYAAILAAISSRVAALYADLHPGEGLGQVAIEPWTDKGLELVVGFHGSRQRPPHGVLSESHLNSLAVALFLAMAEMFNERLDVIVLDDVVNSFDSEHRGRLAELLVRQFDRHQVIVLTHDHQFYLHLIRRAPAWHHIELTSWSFEDGPREARYASGPLLEAAEGAVADGDVRGAAQKARRALEEVLDEACERMGASLRFRRGSANDRRDVSELMSGLRGRVRSLSRDWYGRLDQLLTDLEADVQASLNIEVHAGRGHSSTPEVEAALQRIRELDAAFRCNACTSRIWAKGSTSAGRCDCGQSAFPPRARSGPVA